MEYADIHGCNVTKYRWQLLNYIYMSIYTWKFKLWLFKKKIFFNLNVQAVANDSPSPFRCFGIWFPVLAALDRMCTLPNKEGGENEKECWLPSIILLHAYPPLWTLSRRDVVWLTARSCGSLQTIQNDVRKTWLTYWLQKSIICCYLLSHLFFTWS